MTTTKIEEPPSDLDWIQLRKDIGSTHQVETNLERLKRKFKENPFVPIGVLATTLALGFGLASFRSGKQRMSQTMMRFRIAAQGFTILAVVTGVAIGSGSSLKK